MTTIFTAHRKNDGNVYERIDEILHHHKIRLEDVINIVSDCPGLTAYEIASKMKWSIRAKNWNEFPVTQKWFAVGETIAHIEYLLNREVLMKEKKRKCIFYKVKMLKKAEN